jgi:hypothetical protein
MALLNNKNVKFNQIRLIVGVEGFEINNEFIVKEIGYATENHFDVIKLQYTNKKQMSYFNRKKIYYLSNEHHGIDLYNNKNYWPKHSDAASIIQTLYQITASKQNPEKTYIAYNNDIHIRTLIHKAGLDQVSVNVKDLFWSPIPSLNTLKSEKVYNTGVYKICDLHDLNSEKNFQCAKSKIKLLFDICVDKAIWQNNYSKDG